MTDMVFEFEYFWAILLLFIMERICCLQEQFDRDFTKLPDPQGSRVSIHLDIEDFGNADAGLKLSFLRLCQMMHGSMLLALVYFCNISVWYLMSPKTSPRTLLYKFKITIPT